jgi:hypothetical protein
VLVKFLTEGFEPFLIHSPKREKTCINSEKEMQAFRLVQLIKLIPSVLDIRAFLDSLSKAETGAV